MTVGRGLDGKGIVVQVSEARLYIQRHRCQLAKCLCVFDPFEFEHAPTELSFPVESLERPPALRFSFQYNIVLIMIGMILFAPSVNRQAFVMVPVISSGGSSCSRKFGVSSGHQRSSEFARS